MTQESTRKIVRLVFLGILVAHALLVIGTWFIRVDRLATSDLLALPSLNQVIEPSDSRIVQTANPSSFADALEDNSVYGEAVFNWNDPGSRVTLTWQVPQEGNYQIALDYQSLNNEIMPIEIDLSINDELQDEWRNIRLRTYWTARNVATRYDAYGNQIQAPQMRYDVWQTQILTDQQFTLSEGLILPFNSGENVVNLTLLKGHLRLGRIYLLQVPIVRNYETYDVQMANYPVIENGLIRFEAEQMLYKSSPKIRLTSVVSPSVSPYQGNTNALNVISEDYFDESGFNLTYAMEVETAGRYEITLKYQIKALNKIIYANIYIDHQIPFQELRNYPFQSSSRWLNETLGNDQPFKIFLDEGIHTLTFELTTNPTRELHHNLQQVIDEMGVLQIELLRLTSGSQDIIREWNLTKFIPDVVTRLEQWESRLSAMLANANDLTAVHPNRTNDLTRRIQSALNKIRNILDDPDLLPQKLNLFSEGSNSAVADLSVALTESFDQGISLDQLFIHGSKDSLPQAQKSWLAEYFATIQKIGQSAQIKDESDDDKVIDVWVYRSRYTLNVMQQFVDANYTAEDGTKVRLSILPDEMKITLSNAANTQPDAVVGISGWNPFELGLRGAVIPLETMPGFAETIQEFTPGSLLHMMRDGHVYGLPETQDFFVTFYREDILADLGIDVPETYQDIIEILPTLQAYGMNYYLPLSSPSGLKAINFTAPFIYQNNGNLFTEDAFETAIDSPNSLSGITQMIELYTTYGLPLQVPNFYDEFRSGRMPIGVGSFGDYLKFSFAAPEIANKWSIALPPGVRQSDGSIARQYAGTAQSVAIFKKSTKQLQSWEFLQWWLHSSTQREFIFDLQNTYGQEYVWNTANMESIDALPFNANHIAIIRQQWESLQEVPKIPGGFAIERGISDVWNKAVLQGANIRTAINDATLIINREIKRKMAEFGYLDMDGNSLKPYILPTLDDVIAFQEGGNPSP